MDHETEFDWDETLHRMSIIGGAVMAIISVFFSYDGLDQTANGINPSYSDMAKIIGIAMAVLVTLIQFIFNTDIKNLTWTLIIGGFISYIYSMYTNYLGISHLFGFTGILGWIISFFWDALPEAMIAWGLRDTSNGDMIRNMLSPILGIGRKSSKKSNRPEQRREPSFNAQTDKPRNMPMPFSNQPKKGQGRAFYEAQRNNNQKKQDTQPNRFEMFGKDE